MKINKWLLVILLFTQAVFANKPDLFLLKTYDGSKDVIGWVMSEKLDGVRGYWDGQKLISRSGQAFNPPKWWVKNFPPFAIDGELWTRRDDFENIVSIVRTKKANNRWQQITFNVFEVPAQQGGLLQRLKVLAKYLKNKPSQYITILPQIPIQKTQQLTHFLNTIVANKGEGVVVRSPTKPYQTGRLPSALKVKKYLDDECVITKILTGKGKYKNKMGSVKCQIASGKIIIIGSGFSDFERENPPKIGTKITFKYYGLTHKGNFKYPVFLRVFLKNSTLPIKSSN